MRWATVMRGGFVVARRRDVGEEEGKDALLLL